MTFLRGLWQGCREFWGLSWWAKGPILGLLAVLLIAAIASGGSGSGDAASDGDGLSVEEAARELIAKTPKAAPTVLVTTEPAPSPEVTVIVQTPEPTEPPPGPETTFGDGTYAVGTDIQAGTYQGGCPEGGYWARLSGFGGSFDEIIANDGPDGPTIVTISPSDVGFETRGCIWTITP